MIKIISLFFILVLFSSCESSPMPRDMVIEKCGHVYVWRKDLGYVHDEKCPTCKGEENDG